MRLGGLRPRSFLLQAFHHSLPPPLVSLVRLVLPSHSNDHLMHVLSDVGISFDPSLSSSSALLDIVRANEVAQVAISKAKEMAAQGGNPPVVAGGTASDTGRGQVTSTAAKQGKAKRANSCIAPCRSSLRIKNLSVR